MMDILLFLICFDSSEVFGIGAEFEQPTIAHQAV